MTSLPSIPEPPKAVQPERAPVPPVEEPEQTAIPMPETPDWRLVGELYRTYIIVEQGEDAFLIDKHAAHERILFDKLRANQERMTAQSLLSPIPCRLTPELAATLLENQGLLDKLGFEIEEFGENTVLLRQIPMDLDPENAKEALEELASDLAQGKQKDPGNLRDELLHAVACKAAIKAGWHTDEAELLALVKQVMEREDLKYCPPRTAHLRDPQQEAAGKAVPPDMRNDTLRRVIPAMTAALVAMTAVLAAAYGQTQAAWMLTAAISFGTTGYHFLIRLLVGGGHEGDFPEPALMGKALVPATELGSGLLSLPAGPPLEGQNAHLPAGGVCRQRQFSGSRDPGRVHCGTGP